MKQIIKSHHDVITVPEAIKALMSDYTEIGYQVERISIMNFKIIFPDGWVHIFWENGAFYQEIFSSKIA